MELYEVVEVCPYCDSENILQWNTETMGFVATCQHCGKKMMLCDECQHTILVDGEVHDCDWCEDCGGTCHRDNSPITLITRGKYDDEEDDYSELHFSVPINWLKDYISDKWQSLEEFLSKYTWDVSLKVYEKAFAHKEIVAAEEIYRGKDL